MESKKTTNKNVLIDKREDVIKFLIKLYENQEKIKISYQLQKS